MILFTILVQLISFTLVCVCRYFLSFPPFINSNVLPENRIEIWNSRRTPSSPSSPFCLPRVACLEGLCAVAGSPCLPMNGALVVRCVDLLRVVVVLVSRCCRRERNVPRRFGGKERWELRPESRMKTTDPIQKLVPMQKYWRLEMTSGLTSQDRSSQKRRHRF